MLRILGSFRDTFRKGRPGGRGYCLLLSGMTALLFFLCLTAGAYADEQGAGKKCPTVEVKSIEAHQGPIYSSPSAINTTSPTMETAPDAPEQTRGAAEKPVRIVALRRLVDMKFSRDVKTEVSCTAKGFMVTATLLFMDPYPRHNPDWRPEIKIVAVPLRRGVRVDVNGRCV